MIKQSLIGQSKYWWERLYIPPTPATILMYETELGDPYTLSPSFIFNDTYKCSSDWPEYKGEIG